MHGNLVQVCLCNWDSKMEIPASDSFEQPERTGSLLKLVGRGWLYSGSWKKRFCVLDGSKLFFYESQKSKGAEKSSGVINLDYYDVCEESKDKKNTHVFIIGTSVKGFFDNRHQFSAESSDEMESWIHSIQTAIAEARLTRRKPSEKGRQESLSQEVTCLVAATKDRPKGPQGRRLPQRKSMMPTSHTAESIEDTKVRSISLSTPLPEADELEDSAFVNENSNESKWMSASLEEVDRDNRHSGGEPNQPLPKKKILGNNLLGQHAALTRELEAKLKIPPRKPVSVSSDEDSSSRRLDSLSKQVESTAVSLSALELRVGSLTTETETSTEKVGDLLLQVTVTLKEAERINGECKRALEGATRARAEYQALVQECKATLAELRPHDGQPALAQD